MALTADAHREFIETDTDTASEDYPVAAGATITAGMAIGEDGNGYARPFEDGDPLLGFAEHGAVGGAVVRVRTRGRVVVETIPYGSSQLLSANVVVVNAWLFPAGASTVSYRLLGFISRVREDGSSVLAFDALATRMHSQVLTDAAP